MQISTLTSTPVDSTNSLASLLSAASTDTTTATSATSTAAASTDVSKPGELLSKLEQLKEKDPTKFKQVMSDMATKLKNLASSDTDSAGAKRLTDLASKFQTAADTGDLSALQPPKPPSGATGSSTDGATNAAVSSYTKHGGHHHHAGGSPPADTGDSSSSTSSTTSASSLTSSASSSSTSTQVKDLFTSLEQTLTSALS